VGTGPPVGPGERDAREVQGPGLADACIGRDETLLGLTDVGPALQEIGGQALRDGREREPVDGLPPGYGAGVPPEEKGQRVLLQGYELLDGGYPRQGQRVLGLDLAYLQVRDDPALRTDLEEVDGLLRVLGRAPRYEELVVQVEEIDVPRGHRRAEGEDHPSPRLLGGQEVRQRGLVGPAVPAPDVELPRGTEAGLVLVEGVGNDRREPAGAVLGDAALAGLVRGIHRGEEVGAGHHEAALVLAHPGGRDPEVPVLVERGRYESVERRVAEPPPPQGVGHILGVLCLDPPCRGGLHVGPSVVGAQGAPGTDHGNDRHEQELTHGGLPPCSRKGGPPRGGGRAAGSR